MNDNIVIKSVQIIFLLFLGQILPISAVDHKIVVISDPHVMVEELLVKDGKAYQKYQKITTRMCDYSMAIFNQAIKDILAMSPKPELVLIPGDISKDGELVNHLYVKSKLDELKEAGIASLVVPGNHDWGERRRAVYYDGDSTKAALTCVRFGSDQKSLEMIYADYGFKSCYTNSTKTSMPVDRESFSSTLTYACEPIKDVVLIGIDTGNNGVLSKKTLDWICSRALIASRAGKQVFAIMHYPLVTLDPKAHVRYPSKKQDTDYNGYKIVRNRMADSGVKVIFTGHTHIQEISKDWNANFSREIYDVTTGSICTYPCYYRVMTLSEDLGKLSITTSSIKTAGRSLLGNPFSMEKALLRFSPVVSLESKTKKLVAAGFKRDLAYEAASYLRDSRIYHAEGEENKNVKAQEALSKLKQIFAYDQIYLEKLIMKLSDISNFSEPKRANQTDDNTLVIPLSPNY